MHHGPRRFGHPNLRGTQKHHPPNRFRTTVCPVPQKQRPARRFGQTRSLLWQRRPNRRWTWICSPRLFVQRTVHGQRARDRSPSIDDVRYRVQPLCKPLGQHRVLRQRPCRYQPTDGQSLRRRLAKILERSSRDQRRDLGRQQTRTHQGGPRVRCRGPQAIVL